jgi:hypothetical protein
VASEFLELEEELDVAGSAALTGDLVAAANEVEGGGFAVGFAEGDGVEAGFIDFGGIGEDSVGAEVDLVISEVGMEKDGAVEAEFVKRDVADEPNFGWGACDRIRRVRRGFW